MARVYQDGSTNHMRQVPSFDLSYRHGHADGFSGGVSLEKMWRRDPKPLAGLYRGPRQRDLGQQAGPIVPHLGSDSVLQTR